MKKIYECMLEADTITKELTGARMREFGVKCGPGLRGVFKR